MLSTMCFVLCVCVWTKWLIEEKYLEFWILFIKLRKRRTTMARQHLIWQKFYIGFWPIQTIILQFYSWVNFFHCMICFKKKTKKIFSIPKFFKHLSTMFIIYKQFWLPHTNIEFDWLRMCNGTCLMMVVYEPKFFFINNTTTYVYLNAKQKSIS